MGKCCGVPWCKNKLGKECKEKGIHFHKIPKRNMREKWVKAIRQERNEENWTPHSSSVICSAHFKPEDYEIMMSGGETKYKLKKHVFPIFKESDIGNNVIPKTAETSRNTQNGGMNAAIITPIYFTGIPHLYYIPQIIAPNPSNQTSVFNSIPGELNCKMEESVDKEQNSPIEKGIKKFIIDKQNPIEEKQEIPYWAEPSEPVNLDIHQDDQLEEIQVKVECDPNIELSTYAKETYDCTMGSNSFEETQVILENDPNVELSTYAKETYNCTECGESFVREKHPNLLGVHKSAKEKRILKKIFNCTVCDKSFDRPSRLQKHLRVHERERTYKCTYNNRCKKSFFTSNRLSTHLSAHLLEKQRYANRPQNKFECDRCGKTVTSQQSLMRHKKLHDGYIACAGCRKLFPDWNTLNLHQETHTKLRCDQCPYVTYDKRRMVVHMEMHFGKKFKCELCGKVFKLLQNLKRHIKYHDGYLTCSKCTRQFPDESSLEVHMANHPKFQCHHCSYVTLRRHSLVEHLDSHSARFKCKICKKKFQRRILLERHLALHSK